MISVVLNIVAILHVFVLLLGMQWLLWTVMMGWRWRSFFLRDVHVHTASLSLTHNALQVWAEVTLIINDCNFWTHFNHMTGPQAWTTALVITEAALISVCRGRADSPAAVPTPETARVSSRTRTSEVTRDWETLRTEEGMISVP